METFLTGRRSLLMGLFATVAGASVAVAGLVHAQAKDCPRPPQMDERFCDRDGDLIADVPEDPKEWVDPDTLVFAYTPVEDPSTYKELWADFIDHLAKVTGKNIEFFSVQSNAAQLEAMRAGRLHVSGFNSGSVPLAVNAVGFRPFAMMAAKDGRYGYRMEIIVPADSDIDSLDDLKAKKVAFTAPTSNSGYKAPVALLEAEVGLEEGKDYESVFSGNHENSILGVANKDYDAGAIADQVRRRVEARGAIKPEDLRIIYKSEIFPTTAYGVVYNLNPELAKKVEEAFLTFDWTGTKLAEEFGKSDPPQETFIPISYEEYWRVIRQIDEISGVEYKL
ncbi:MAG: phosphate/phosphite/phosphonate ABC transporter substrate-binding protein [Thermostichus sp. DG02_5_bins_236]